MPDLPGMIAGSVGLISLISRNWVSHPDVQVIVCVFFGLSAIILLPLLLVSALGLSSTDFQDLGAILACVPAWVVFVVLSSPFFCDLALAAMTNNWFGTPSRTSSYLYWSYFVLERLTIFIS
jgi:hypothetical protein